MSEDITIARADLTALCSAIMENWEENFSSDSYEPSYTFCTFCYARAYDWDIGGVLVHTDQCPVPIAQDIQPRT